MPELNEQGRLIAHLLGTCLVETWELVSDELAVKQAVISASDLQVLVCSHVTLPVPVIIFQDVSGS